MTMHYALKRTTRRLAAVLAAVLLIPIGAAAMGPAAHASAGLEPVVVLTPEAPGGGRLVADAGQSVTFDASGSYSPTGAPLTVWWWVDTEGPYAVGQDTYTPWLSVGNHVVTVTVMDTSTRKQERAQRTVQVGPDAKPKAVVSPAAPQPVRVGTSIQFSGTDSLRLAEGASCQWYVDGKPVANDGEPNSNGETGTCNFWADNWDEIRPPRLTYVPTTAGRHTIRLRVQDMIGAANSAVVVVTATGTQKPVASFTPDGNRTLSVGATATFDGSASYDPDGSRLKFRWSSTGVRGVASAKTTYTRTFDKPGKYRVRLTVYDSDNMRSSHVVTITVKGTQAPVASFSPGIDQTVEVGTRIVFDGSASNDPDGGKLRYRWHTTGIRGTVSKTASYARTFEKAGTFRVQLVVRDVDLNWSAKTVTITVI